MKRMISLALGLSSMIALAACEPTASVTEGESSASSIEAMEASSEAVSSDAAVLDGSIDAGTEVEAGGDAQ